MSSERFSAPVASSARPDMGFVPQPLHPPRPWLLLILLSIVIPLQLWVFHPQSGPVGLAIGLYASVVWSVPIGITALIAYGAVLARADMRRERRRADPAPVTELLVVQIPTIGRHDVIPALRRVVESFERELPSHFRHWRVDVVAEESSPARAELDAMTSPHVRVLYVPADYTTANGTERKARANEWMNELRKTEDEDGHDVWVLHMDDDTGIGPDTPASLARVIHDNPAYNRRSADLAQGVLTYPRQYASSFWPWMADAIRPGSDLSLFHLSTGGGSPFIGAHGELLLVRSSVEAELGWDYGRLLSITEDANFALTFGSLPHRRSEWFAGRCYGGSPENFRDLVAQRRRWARGLLHVAANFSLPFRSRFLLSYAMLAWFLGPFQHVLTVGLVAVLLRSPNTSPLARELVLLWGFNLCVVLWMYVEGLRANVHASGVARVPARWWVGLLAIPWFTFVEGWAAARGCVDFVRDRLGLNEEGDLFHVIAKTHDAGASGRHG